ncbi:MAG TPA: HypC/HybG/HupF family hydrogenase formation chaperone [Thermoanaerobaculia bacterium]|nr:HypC/HybG/HupF family hydrogenase formation chaperone [Thermoanaerobaculia bacterium]
MCLGVPGQIVRIEGRKATVDFWGIRKDVSLELLTDSVQPGDFVINHAGFAVRRVPACDVPDTLALYEVILSEAGEDPIACDVVRELEEVEELVGV